MTRRRREQLVRQLPLVRYTERTICEPSTLLRELERVRPQGLATDAAELHPGLICVAVPVMGPGRRVAAALALGAPEARLTLAQAMAQVPVMRRAANAIAATLRAGDGAGRRDRARRAAE